MFTGIIEERGRITRWERTAEGGARLTIEAPLVTEDAGHGDSIAVSGVCLTVVAHGEGRFTADVRGRAGGPDRAGPRRRRRRGAAGARRGVVAHAALLPSRRPRAARRRQGLH